MLPFHVFVMLLSLGSSFLKLLSSKHKKDTHLFCLSYAMFRIHISDINVTALLFMSL